MFFNSLRKKVTAAPSQLARATSENFCAPAAKMAAVETKSGAIPVPRRAALGDITNNEPRRPAAIGLKPSVQVMKTNGAATRQTSAAAVRQASGSLRLTVAKAHSTLSSNALMMQPAAVSQVQATKRLTARSVSCVTAAVPTHHLLQDQHRALVVPPSVPAFSVLPGSGSFMEPMAIDSDGALPEPLGMMEDSDVEDIDAYDYQDPLFCTEYVSDIYSFLREKEQAERVDPGYMRRQPDLNERMRAILVDWLVEVSVKFKLFTETFFLTVTCIDKFLERCPVERKNLQLVGVTAMLIASKIEETCPVEVNDFIYIVDKVYTREQMLELEKVMLAALEFKLLAPSPLHFLRRFSKAAKNDSQTHTLGKFLIEVASVEFECLQLLPSEVAAGAVYLARHMLGMLPLWSSTMEYYLKYSQHEVLRSARLLQSLLKRPTNPSLTAVRKKYASAKLYSVSKISPGPDL